MSTPLATDGVTAITAALQNDTAAHAVQNHASAAARTASGIARHEGQLTALADTDRIEAYDGATDQRIAWWSVVGRSGWWGRRAANLAVATSTDTDFVCDAEDGDTDSYGAAGAATLTVPNVAALAGLYFASAHIKFSADPTTARLHLQWTRAGGVVVMTTTELGSAARPTAGGFYLMGVTGIMPLAQLDTVKAVVRQTSGGSLNVTGYLEFIRLAI